VPYSVVVHARSSLNMGAFLTQNSYEPGATFHLRAVLTEIGLPVDHRGRRNRGGPSDRNSHAAITNAMCQLALLPNTHYAGPS
jgi:hypothetical protein